MQKLKKKKGKRHKMLLYPNLNSAQTRVRRFMLYITCVTLCLWLLQTRVPKQKILGETTIEKMKRRLEILQNTCNQRNETILSDIEFLIEHQENFTFIEENIQRRPSIFFFRPNSLGWCKVPRAASTSIFAVFSQLLSTKNETNSSTYYTQEEIEDLMMPTEDDWGVQNNSSLLIARHPFERILSVFRSKLRDRGLKGFSSFYDRYSKTMIQNYRNVTPADPRLSDLPTFKEFVNYLIDTPVWQYDEHWLPIYLTCAPCHNDFNIIMHMESLDDDWEYLTNVTKIELLKLPHNHSSKLQIDEKPLGTSQSSPKHEDIERFHYSTITKDHLGKLYKIYEIDFEMFQFSIHPFDTYVRN